MDRLQVNILHYQIILITSFKFVYTAIPTLSVSLSFIDSEK